MNTMDYCDILSSKPALAALSVLFTSLGWRALGSLLHRYFLRRMTVLPDLPKLGQPRADSKRIKGAAVVCGGRFIPVRSH